jgi:hypothetical protein
VEAKVMAYVLTERDICYIHIPKTSGTWVKRVLGEIEYGHRDGSITHDLPHRWDYGTIFTVVREPAEWLASVWAHRVRLKWEPYPQRVPWQLLCQVLEPYQENKFDKFIDRVTRQLPGLVGWFYGIYTPPPVAIFRKEYDIHSWLRYLGGDPDSVEPVNVGFNSPEVTPEIREKVELAEYRTYERFGYPLVTRIDA